MIRRPSLSHFLLSACLLLVTAGALTAPARAKKDQGELSKKEEKALVAQLPQVYQAWLEEVELLITDEELEVFLALAKDYQRDAFIEKFWRQRDPYPGTARNELRDRWDKRVARARESYGSFKDGRARILLLNGFPDYVMEVKNRPRASPTEEVVSCTAGMLWPLELWFYAGSDRVGFRFFIVFYQKGHVGLYRIWDPTLGLDELFQDLNDKPVSLASIVNHCFRGDEVAGPINWVLQQGITGWGSLITRLEQSPLPDSTEWAATFASYSTDLPDAANTFAAELAFAFPGRKQTRTVVQGIVKVPVGEVARAHLAGHTSYNMILTGEVLEEGGLFDVFRYKFDLPSNEIDSERIPLVFERYLRPGSYEFVVKVEDLNAGSYYRERTTVEVPKVEGQASPPPPEDEETARLLAEANRLIATGDATIEIVRPIGDIQTGLTRIDTLTTGDDIAKVEFAVDGRLILTKNRPPYSVELDLGLVPRSRLLRVTAFNDLEEEVASDELLINAGGHRFAVRLVEPRRGVKYSRSLRAEADVEVPEGRSVERVEFYLNERLLATLYQPPFAQTIVLPNGNEMAYVRTVAYLPDGNSTEDVVFVNAPDYLEEIDVQLVELFATALDKQGRAVTDLTRNDFTVFEDGEQQSILRFEKMDDLPFHAGILLDVSASMDERLDAARQAALRFFEDTIKPRDRAAVVTFNDRPYLTVKFTNRQDELAGGLAGLKAERGTSLYDSVIFALYYFNGIKGQRALLILSDGQDESSRFAFEDALDFARRAGVTVYSVGLDLPKNDARKKLGQLAEETGGRSFFIEHVSELGPVYDAIEEELRSQYLIAYQSSNASGSEAFRTVELQVARSGVEVKTQSGYYP